MNDARRIANSLVLSCLAILIAACANEMEPAKNALDNINTTLNAVSPDARKYVPDEFSAAQSKVSGLTSSFEKKDYAAVVSAAPAVLAEVSGLAAAAAAKKDESLKALGNEWRSLAASVPQSITDIQNRIDTLSKARRVPKDIDVSAAKSELVDAKASWDKAQSTFKLGNVEDAIGAANEANTKLQSAARALKVDISQTSQ